MSRQIVLVVIAALTVTGCGGSGGQTPAQSSGQSAPQAAQPPQASQAPAQQPGSPAAAAQSGQQASQPAQQGTQQLAQGLQQLAQGLQQMGQKDASGKPVPPIDFEKLEALLPSPGGWTKGKSKGQQVTAIVATSNAEVDYTKGPMSAHLEITDSALSQLLLAPLSMMLAAGYSERSSSGYKKSVTMSGSPAYEEWSNDDKHGEVTVLVNNRFIVQARGSNLDNIDSLRGIVNQVDLNKLAALK